MRSFSIVALAQHAFNNAELRESLCIDDDETATECETAIEHYAASMTTALAAYFDANALLKYDAALQTIAVDTQNISAIDAICTLIHFEYDNDAPTKRSSIWEMFDLSGDDDVDYNSSYITMLLEIVKSYADANPA